MNILIIEDDDILARALTQALKQIDMSATHIDNFEESKRYIEQTGSLSAKHPIVLLDIALPDGSGLKIAEIIREQPPIPYIIGISGTASPAQAFRLKELGVKAFLEKPFGIEDIKAKIVSALTEEIAIDESAISAIVGALPLKEATGKVRQAMLVKALTMTHGNLTHAADLLKITRQGVQNMVHEFELNIETFKSKKE